MPQPSISLKKTHLLVITLVMLQIVSIGLTVYDLQQKQRLIDYKLNQFNQDLDDNQFLQAKEIYDDLMMHSAGKQLENLQSKLINSLHSKVAMISDTILDEESSDQTYEKIKNAAVFKQEIGGMIDDELKQVTQSYLDNALDFSVLTHYYEIIKMLGFSELVSPYEKSANTMFNSRQNLKLARDYYKEQNYLQALENYKKILPDTPENYAAAQKEITQCQADFYQNYLTNAGQLAQNQQYEQAIQLLETLSPYFPKDAKVSSLLEQYRQAKDFVPYTGPVEHIFFHPLIAYPELAFDHDVKSKGYNDWFVTVKEFNRILDQLYQNNFILVDLHSIYTRNDENGTITITPKTLRLPRGKKPLIISVDDLNYYDYMRENGNVFKLILDNDGTIATYSKTPQGQEIISHDNEIIPLLDNFVKEHPDFSLNGAKGTIALTGYEGILGYRTNLDSPTQDIDSQQVLPIIKRLKETGWSFASHGYGHLAAGEISLATLKKDTERWLNEVEPLIGPTDVYIYPFGSSVLPGDPKFQYLLDAGFDALCSVGPNPYRKYGPNYLMMDRRHIDGISLLTQGDSLKSLFDSKTVVDTVRPH